MENFIARFKSFCLCLLIFFSLSLASQENIIINASRSTLDRDSNSASFENLVIEHNNIMISALLAQVDSLNFEKNIWTFSGDFRLKNSSFALSAISGQVEFNNYSITGAVFNGSPALFNSESTAGIISFGRSNKIEFNQEEDILRFLGDAQVNISNTSFSGCDLIYDIQNERVSAGYSECGENIQITINMDDLE
jgi:lipopolysaccharide transport protein LptA